ncbi:hypothetical protein FE784_03230 [Paenibacillus hemerocallicola]|uniref:Uncharacterized protein n=1 Tax=Paenibacillus hemerocallicola TaxID=1172614 RepID=A0A5C4TGR4_9BACL|nr:hypothetical protein [Paenibacillus hemerocallicola]TNJ67777.1 hypothetical protein FE784_03230 [Paenibacillus hemerocallicola]
MVEPILYPGPESFSSPEEWVALRELMRKNDPNHYVKTLHISEQRLGRPDGWNGGPQWQIGMTGTLDPAAFAA